MPVAPRPAAERFWVKVDKTGDCWIFTGAINDRGYGCFRFDCVRTMELAHRVSWELANGPIPDGLCVLHHCDNPPCVRVDHLFLGTRADNAADCGMKGRWNPHGRTTVCGEAHPDARLTNTDVLAIRHDYEQGVFQRVLAERFGVSQGTIHDVVVRKTWKHL